MRSGRESWGYVGKILRLECERGCGAWEKLDVIDKDVCERFELLRFKFPRFREFKGVIGVKGFKGVTDGFGLSWWALGPSYVKCYFGFLKFIYIFLLKIVEYISIYTFVILWKLNPCEISAFFISLGYVLRSYDIIFKASR